MYYLESKVVTVLVATILFCRISEAQTLERIRIGSTTPSITSLPTEIAVRKGFFRQEGLDPEIILIRGADITIKALLTRHIDYATPLPSLVAAAMRGLPVKLIGIIVKKTSFVLVSNPSIRSIPELKGKTVGVGNLGAAADFVLRAALRSGGLDPNHDVKILSLGGSRERFASLQAGVIAATVLVAPYNLQAEKLGFRSLLWLGKLMDLPQGGLGAHEEKLTKNPDEVVRVMKAASRGIRFIKSNKEATVDFMMQWQNLDRPVAEVLYPMLIESLADYGITDDAAVRNALAMGKHQTRIDKDIPLDQIRDWTFARRARDEIMRSSASK